MGQLTRRLVVPLLVGALGLTAACGGSDDQGKAAAKSEGSGTSEKQAAPKEIKTQRWPRYWATVDAAETGASDAGRTGYFAGYDDTSIVYTGQDVIRFLDRETGKQRKQVVLKGSRLVCDSQPRRQMENGTVLIGTGIDDVDACDSVEAYNTATGARKWTYGTQGNGDEMTIDQRDGVAMVAMSPGAGEDGPGSIAGIDIASGRVLWRHGAPDYFFGRPAKKKDDCFVNSALAADRPVVIAFLGCDAFPSDKLPGVYGIDLKTGEQLWTTPFWDKPEYLYVSDGQQVHPHWDDGRSFLRTEVNTPVRVDSETGEVTKVVEPAPEKIDGHPMWWPMCNDFRALEIGIPEERSDSCVFTNGEVMVFVREIVPARNTIQIQLQAVDADTGKRLWTYDKRAVNQPKKYVYHYLEFLGWNADRSEFWVLQDQKDIVRLDSKTGERVGQGLAAPPMELINFAIAGPKFVLTRTVGGITNPDGTGLKSGTNYYVTDAD